MPSGWKCMVLLSILARYHLLNSLTYTYIILHNFKVWLNVDLELALVAIHKYRVLSPLLLCLNIKKQNYIWISDVRLLFFFFRIQMVEKFSWAWHHLAWWSFKIISKLILLGKISFLLVYFFAKIVYTKKGRFSKNPLS